MLQVLFEPVTTRCMLLIDGHDERYPGEGWYHVISSGCERFKVADQSVHWGKQQVNTQPLKRESWALAPGDGSSKSAQSTSLTRWVWWISVGRWIGCHAHLTHPVSFAKLHFVNEGWDSKWIYWYLCSVSAAGGWGRYGRCWPPLCSPAALLFSWTLWKATAHSLVSP